VRIAMISTPFVPVPPPRYGGTELIVDELVRGLVQAGHDVTLFATGDSQAPVPLRALVPRAVWPPDPSLELDHAAWAIGEIAGDARRWDVVHGHVPPLLPLARFIDAPLVQTIHHDRDEALVGRYAGSSAQLVAISERQRALLPEAQSVVIHHGLSPSRFTLGQGQGGYLAFVGRLAPEKGAHVAVEVAAAAGLPLKLAGRPHWRDQRYFREEVLPRVARSRAMLVGEVGGLQKSRLLGAATALLFPVAWEEPFGLVMIEAMLSGTPVVALARGAVPEVVEDGLTGFVCADPVEMTARVRQIAAGGFDRRRCRARAVQRWSAGRMVAEYQALYRQRRRSWESAAARSVAR
jgi:glycosyltransferase involved in cell wall biosynthesis